jgi:hypothetical protein
MSPLETLHNEARHLLLENLNQAKIIDQILENMRRNTKTRKSQFIRPETSEIAEEKTRNPENKQNDVEDRTKECLTTQKGIKCQKKKSNACGHPEKPHYAKEMCNGCYQRHRREEGSVATKDRLTYPLKEQNQN